MYDSRTTSIGICPTFAYLKSKQDNLSLYFVALVPEKALRSELTELKQWIFDEFGSKGALRSPPHITLLMPFKWKHTKEDLLVNSLENLASNNSTLDIILENYGCFEPRVLYVNVLENEELRALRTQVMKLSRANWKLDLPKDLRGFKPHITIGFRDLKKPVFYKAWEQLKDKSYTANFKACHLTLLKHTGKYWEVYRQLPFRETSFS